MMLRVISAAASPPRGVLLAPGVALIMMSAPDRSVRAPGISFRGRPLPAPQGTVTVQTDPNVLQVAAVRLPPDQRDDLPLLVESNNGEHLPLHFSELSTDPLAIAAGLDGAARWRLLEFLLNFCCAAFRLGTTPAFARMCTSLAVDCTQHAGVATVEAQVVAGRVLLSGMSVPRGSTLCILRRNSVVHSPLQVLEMGHLQVVPQVGSGDLILACGPDPVSWTIDEPPIVPHVLALPESGQTPGRVARAACRQALVRGVPKDVAGAFLRDMDILYPAPARKIDDLAQPICGEVERAIPDGEGGIFLSGWLRDPLGMIGSMELATDADRVALEADSMVRVARPDITKRFASASHRSADAKPGFVAFISGLNSGYTVQPHLLLRLKSGSRIELTPAPRSLAPAAARDIVLGCVPAGLITPAMMQQCIAPAAARLHRAAMQTRNPIEVIQIGKRAAKPAVSILIPLYRNLGFLRFQVAALAEDPECRRSEIIYILDSPEQRHDVEHILRGLYQTTELATTLVIMPQNLGYAAANNAGASEARGAILLLLNSDVVPMAPGWLRPLLEPFSRSVVGVVGPKLLFEDGSIQHAGLYFERAEDDIWFNRHYHKGMPRRWADAQVRREVPGVTGAALAIRRKIFEQVDGVSEDYIIGDYEDSDLCLRVRAAGHSIFYVPEAELYHFERRSIGLHAGYMRTHASLYNRLLHHKRWNDAMSELMTESTPTRRRRA